MSQTDFKIELDVLKQGFDTTINIVVVDRSIIDDEHIEHLLGDLPHSDTDRIDSEDNRPFVGIDIFYDKDASLKGILLVAGTQALAIRVPADVAKKSAAAYEKELKAAAKKSAGKSKEKTKGKKEESSVPKVTSSERLRTLLGCNLVGFGMAQISLTLWHFLRERVNGVNLSTIASPAMKPPSAIQNSKEDAESAADLKAQGGKHAHNPGSKNIKGKSRKKGRQGESSTPKTQPKRTPEELEGKDETTETAKPASPDDEPDNWDRLPMSPGEVVQEIFPNVQKIDINTLFMGEHDAVDIEHRVGEAAVRAWISFMVADKLKQDVQKAQAIKPSFLSDKELTFFAESMVNKWKFLGETPVGKTVRLADYEFEGGDVKSNNYGNKIRASRYQYMAHVEGETEKRYFLKRSDKKTSKHTRLAENEDEEDKESAPSNKPNQDDGWTVSSGRKGHQQKRGGQVRGIGENQFESQDWNAAPEDSNPKGPSIEFPENAEVFLYGREEATGADKQHELFLLRLLEGRGSLHGPKYKDCAFIRRVWFPTTAQIRIGEERKARKSKKARTKQDYIDDSWGDDTDEDEVARIQALTLAEGNEDRDDETEDENVGSGDPKRGVSLPPEILLNSSQLGVVGRIVAPNPNQRARATLVHGPPGTGKTSTIAAAVMILAEVGEPVWIVAQSNVGIRNVAEKLQEVGFQDFVLLVAQEYESYWEERYRSLKGYYFLSKLLSKVPYQQRVFNSKAVLCTLATLSSKTLGHKIFSKRPIKHLIIDEASQIDMTSEFMHLFYKHRSTLMSVCWFGDPNQLPPYGSSEGAEIRDIFKADHLLANSRLLDTSYRLPVPIAKFISNRMYEGELKPFLKHKIQEPRKAVVFIDVESGKEENAGNEGKSWKNIAEAEMVIHLVQNYYERQVKQEWEKEEKKLEYAIITPYDGQRAHVQAEINALGLKDRQVYNVDSFQGNEADYIITTIAKTGSPGFLTSRNRMNVLLTRCKRGLIVVSQKDFVQRTDSLLRGLIYSIEPYDPWVSAEDVIAGYVDLPGSPALNKRPQPKVVKPPPASRSDLPPRPSARIGPPSAAQIVRQGLVQPTTASSTPPVKGAWGNASGVSRVKNAWSR